MANEKRLIDANGVIAKAKARRDRYPKGHKVRDHYNGVIGFINDLGNAPTVHAVELPPIKIGDTAYFIIGGKIFRAEVYFIRWEQHKLYGTHSEIYANVVPNYSVGVSFNDFGKTVFLSKEEAEAALAKLDGGNGE